MRKKPENEQVSFLTKVIEQTVRAIVEFEDDVRIECDVVQSRLVTTIYVRMSDMGLVLGDKGATANAIRRIVWTACKKTAYRCDIDFLTHGS